jgi:hypothetical protein
MGKVSLWADSILYFMSPRQPYIVQRANLGKKQMQAPIRLDPNFVPEPSAIYAHSPDSLFLTRDFPPTLFLVDGTGQLRQKWDLGKAPVAWNAPEAKGQPEYQFSSMHQPLKHYDPISCRFFLQLSQTMFWYYPNRTKNVDQAIYNLCTQKWERVYGHTPDFYAQGKDEDLDYPLFLTLPFALEKGDTTFLAHPVSHQVAMLNNQTGKLLGQADLGPSSLPEFAPAYTKQQRDAKGIQAEIDLVALARYGFMAYLTQSRIYVREVLQAQSASQTDQLVNMHERTISYLLFDERFSPVGELTSTVKNPYFLLPLAGKDFVLGTRKSKFQPNEDTLYLYRYFPDKGLRK